MNKIDVIFLTGITTSDVGRENNGEIRRRPKRGTKEEEDPLTTSSSGSVYQLLLRM